MTVGPSDRRTVGLMLAVAALLRSVSPTVRQSVDPGPLLDRASAVFDSVHTLAAAFVQVVTNPLVGEPDTTRGKLFQRRPSYFEMRFTAPKGDRIVADGHHLWLYTPSTTPGQVIRTAIPTAGTTGPNLIGQFVDHARERYQARYVRADTVLADGVADVIALVPKQGDMPYQSAVIWVTRDDGLVRRLEIAESSGQRRIVVLRDVVVNGAVPEGEFRFSVPRGVRVVDQ